MTNLTNINSITLRGKRMETFENISLNNSYGDTEKKKSILSRYVIEKMISQQSQLTAGNNFLIPMEYWNIETNNGVMPENPISEHIELIFMDSGVAEFSDKINNGGVGAIDVFKRESSPTTGDLAAVKIKSSYNYKQVCIPKYIKLNDKVDSSKNKTYTVEVVVLEKTDLTIAAPTVSYFTTSSTFTKSSTIGEALTKIDHPNVSTTGNKTDSTLKVISKSFVLFGDSTGLEFNSNLELDVEFIVDVYIAKSNYNLNLTINSCYRLAPVGSAFKEIVLSPNINSISDLTVEFNDSTTERTDLFTWKNVHVTIPKGFICKDNILDSAKIQSQDFSGLTILDLDYIKLSQVPDLEKPVDRFVVYWNMEDRQMELFYRHKSNVSNDTLFKRNTELYDQTYKLKLIPVKESGVVVKYKYNPTVTSNLPIYFFASAIYDEDYIPYELTENETNGTTPTPTVITIKGTKIAKVEVSEKFRIMQFRFVDNSNNPVDYIIRYSMPYLNTPVLNSVGLGTLFLNDGTTFIEAGMDENDVLSGLINVDVSANDATKCKTICKKIYLGVEFFNSELLSESTGMFRYGYYLYENTESGISILTPCFKEVYVPISCFENTDITNPTVQTKNEKIIKKVMFGNENITTVTVKFYSDDEISSEFEAKTRSINFIQEQNVFGRKFYVIDKSD